MSPHQKTDRQMAHHHDFEHHSIHRIGWLRAAVLGANDGIVSTASLIVGVAAAAGDKQQLLLAGSAALVAGAMSMAAGEYVSVSSQSDIEEADLEMERRALLENPQAELAELTEIYKGRGVEQELAHEVATQLMAHDALGTHARDELGISEIVTARPIQAAGASALAFVVGAALPLSAAALTPVSSMIPVVSAATILSLALLGVLSAQASGSKIMRPLLRVVFWGCAALGVTAGAGALFGAIV